MSAILATYIDGKIVPDEPAEWPNGTRLRVEPEEESIGISEDEQGDDPESIAKWLAWMNSLQPFLTPEEEAEWKKARAEQNAWEIAHWEERSEKLRKFFE